MRERAAPTGQNAFVISFFYKAAAPMGQNARLLCIAT